MWLRWTAISALSGVVAIGASTSAHACAVPLGPYTPARAAAAVLATVVRVEGKGIHAKYHLRTEAIVRGYGRLAPLPPHIVIKVIDFVKGTCGMQSPPLKNGQRITLYYGANRNILRPEAWALAP